jgi:hypothetical protein
MIYGESEEEVRNATLPRGRRVLGVVTLEYPRPR